jgi:transcriptional regulator with XRE-family HTH domain
MEQTDGLKFGALLRQFRAVAGITQQELAERSNLSAEAISTLERGARTRPHRNTIALLARALRLSAQDSALLERAADVSRQVEERMHRAAVKSSVLRLVRRDEHSAVPHNLPRQLTSFVGRERDCAEIAKLLDRHSLVTLVGSGGVGKTRVGLEVVGKQLERYADGVWFVDLAPLRDPSLVGEAILSALQIPSIPGPAIDGIVAYLKRRRSLLLLDNCEHVISSVHEVVTTILQFVRFSSDPCDQPAGAGGRWRARLSPAFA